MASITLRSTKGSPLTNTEMDDNLTNLNDDKLEVASNLSDLDDAPTARTNLGSGTVGDSVFTADTAAEAQQAMDTEVGVDVQAYDAGLQSISGLTTAADKMLYTTASDTYAVADLTTAGRALLDDADAEAQRTTLGLGSLAVQNDISLTGINDLAYGIFYDNSDQSFTADTATVVEFDTAGITEGVSVVSATQITFATAGTYRITARLQFANADSNDRRAVVWFRLDGTDIPYSASEIAVPKASDGGKNTLSVSGILAVTTGQYIEVVAAVEDDGTTLHYHEALSSPYVRPAVPSVILVAERIA